MISTMTMMYTADDVSVHMVNGEIWIGANSGLECCN